MMICSKALFCTSDGWLNWTKEHVGNEVEDQSAPNCTGNKNLWIASNWTQTSYRTAYVLLDF